jgi:putative transcriptional regulator
MGNYFVIGENAIVRAILRSTPNRKHLVIRSHLPELMSRHQLKTAELARLAGVNRSTVSALTRDRATRVDLTALERICTVLGCGLGDLLEIVPDEPPRGNNEAAAESI